MNSGRAELDSRDADERDLPVDVECDHRAVQAEVAVAAEGERAGDVSAELSPFFKAIWKSGVAKGFAFVFHFLKRPFPSLYLDLAEVNGFLSRVERTIPRWPNLVSYAMSCFVIAIGTSVGELTSAALRAETIGPVSVDMGNTACEIPFAPEYIQKVRKRGMIRKKQKTAEC